MEESLNESRASTESMERANQLSAYLKTSLDSDMFRGELTQPKTTKNCDLPIFSDQKVQNYVGMKRGKEYYKKFIHFQNRFRIQGQNKSKQEMYVPQGTEDSRTYQDRFSYYIKQIEQEEVEAEKNSIRKEVIRRAQLKKATGRHLGSSQKKQDEISPTRNTGNADAFAALPKLAQQTQH